MSKPNSTRRTARPRRPDAQATLPLPAARRRFRTRLLAWYRRYGWHLPRRSTEAPYPSLVAEAMFRPPQVEGVMPKYLEWRAKFPGLGTFANGPEADLTSAWRPFGYR